MPLLLLLGAAIAGGLGFTAYEVRGTVQDATRSPVAGVMAVAALGLTVYLLRKGRK